MAKKKIAKPKAEAEGPSAAAVVAAAGTKLPYVPLIPRLKLLLWLECPRCGKDAVIRDAARARIAQDWPRGEVLLFAECDHCRWTATFSTYPPSGGGTAPHGIGEATVSFDSGRGTL